MCGFISYAKRGERTRHEKKSDIKAFVLGAVGCAFTITGMAANGHGQGIADSTTEVNEAKHEAVRSNWMDRTDIVVGLV